VQHAIGKNFGKKLAISICRPYVSGTVGFRFGSPAAERPVALPPQQGRQPWDWPIRSIWCAMSNVAGNTDRIGPSRRDPATMITLVTDGVRFAMDQDRRGQRHPNIAGKESFIIIGNAARAATSGSPSCMCLSEKPWWSLRRSAIDLSDSVDAAEIAAGVGDKR
jgi:hypothetical protein